MEVVFALLLAAATARTLMAFVAWWAELDPIDPDIDNEI